MHQQLNRDALWQNEGVVLCSDLCPTHCLPESQRKVPEHASCQLAKLSPHAHASISTGAHSLPLTTSCCLSLVHLQPTCRGCKHVQTTMVKTEGRTCAATDVIYSSLLNNMFYNSDPDSTIKLYACLSQDLHQHFLILRYWYFQSHLS